VPTKCLISASSIGLIVRKHERHLGDTSVFVNRFAES
jgi:hypothetical protein